MYFGKVEICKNYQKSEKYLCFKHLSIFNECGKRECGKRASSHSEGRAEGLSKMKRTRPGNVAAYRQNSLSAFGFIT